MPSSPSQESARGDACFGSSTFSQSSGREESCRKSAASCSTHNLMFLKKEEDPTSEQFDDDEWIRSLTEAQEATTDVPEYSVMYDQQEVDTQESSAHSNGGVIAEVCLAATWRSKGENCSLDDFDAADQSGYPRRR